MIVNGWQRPSAAHCDTGACVEVAPCESAHCVEVGIHSSGYVNVRASWNHSQAAEFERSEFGAFLRAVKAGEYDHMIDSL